MTRLMPITIGDARIFVGRHHRHNRAPLGGLFAVSVQDDEGSTVGVAIVGRPVARGLCDGVTCEVTRVCTDGMANACSILYGAAARAARALGYRRLITYTLATEPGTSLRASGWTKDADVPARPTWSCPSRPCFQVDMFGNQTRPPGAKMRWVKVFGSTPSQAGITAPDGATGGPNAPADATGAQEAET